MVATVGSISIDLSTNVAKFASGFRSAATTVDRESGRMARSVKGAENAVVSFARASVGAFAAGFGTREIGRYADAWTEAGNKVRAAGEIADRQGRSLSGLNDIAKETRTGVSETVDLYSRLLQATSKVAKSEEEVALATELVNKAFKAGGKSASEQAAGILQLGQALESGTLQGDELRSIRENAGMLARAIADEFGTTIGGLKQLGADGALTSERVFKAILAAQGSINKAFAETTATLGDSITLLKNTLIETIGKLDQAGGFTSQFAIEVGNLNSAIDGVAENPNFATFLKLVGGDIREGSLVDNLLWYISTFDKAATETATDAEKIRAEIQSIEDQIYELILLGGEFDLLNAEKLAEDADLMKQKLKEIENAALSAMASMHRAAEDASMAALEQFNAERLPNITGRTVDSDTGVGVTRYTSTGGGGGNRWYSPEEQARMSREQWADVFGPGSDFEEGQATANRYLSGTADGIGSLDRNMPGYFGDLGSRVSGGFNQIDTTFANLGQTLQALYAQGMNPDVNFGVDQYGPGGVYSNTGGEVGSAGSLARTNSGGGVRIKRPSFGALGMDDTRTVSGSVVSGGTTITLNYVASPGESEKTSRQRAREMLDELQREAARA